jgi:hypothetical protein
MMIMKMTYGLFWLCFVESDYSSIRQICLEYCDLWQQFWDEQIVSYQYEAFRKLA